MPAPTLADYASHSPYSDPGRHRDLLAAVDPDPATLRTVACGAVVHYRSGVDLTPEQRADIDRRWLAAILDGAVGRAGSLAGPRSPEQTLAGCCRDHTLLAVGTLRTHGIPARSRVGFAGYLATSSFRNDHVIVEQWDGTRWRRSDSELDPADGWDFDPTDIPAGPASPFMTAAEAWLAIRAGTADPAGFGPGDDMPDIGGRDFVRDYVLREVAHRHRDELLLWDFWGPMLGLGGLPPALQDRARAAGAEGLPGADLPDAEYDAIADEFAYLLIAADSGDEVAAEELAELYFGDPRLRPGDHVLTLSPLNGVAVTDLAERSGIPGAA